MAPRTDQELLLHLDVAARRLGYSRSTLQRLIRQGEMPTVRVGRTVRVPAAALEVWMVAQLRRQGPVPKSLERWVRAQVRDEGGE